MSVIADERSGIMTAINTATSLTSVPWDGDPLAFNLSPPAVAVQWMSGIDAPTEEHNSGGAYLQNEHFLVLISTGDTTREVDGEDVPLYAADKAFDLMEDISGALNELSVTINSVANAGVCRPYRNPQFGGNTKECLPGHAGQALYLMAFRVERMVE